MSNLPSTRVAIVTGAAQGIGLSIALHLADDGLDVAVNDLPSKNDQLASVVRQIQEKGRQSLAVPGDVSREEDVKSMMSRVVDELGGVDVMVANAGIVVFGPLIETPTEEWDRIMATNLRGLMFCYKYAAIQMIKQNRGGRIIGASSQAGKTGVRNIAAYSATKFAIRGLTQAMSQELAPYEITVNAYAPGQIALAPSPEDAKNNTLLSITNGIPIAQPTVVANLVSYLVKPESYFTTGQTILVNGGVGFD